MAKITYGVAIYNVEKYLHECIESLIAQQSENIEIMLVNDCSTDHSLSICKEYEKRDPRIKLVNFEKNQGVCAVRNYVIENASAKWIYFVDGDDAIPHTFTKCVLPYLTDSLDVIICKYKKFNEVIDSTKLEGNHFGVTKKDLDHDFMTMLGKRVVANYPLNKKYILPDTDIYSIWSKLYRKDFLVENNFRFPEQKKSQDVVFNSMVYPSCRCGAYINLESYLYRLNQNSICVKYNKNIVPIVLSLLDFLKDNIKNYYNDDELVKKSFNFLIVSYIYVCLNLNFINKDNPKKYEEIEKEFLEFLEIDIIKNAIEKCNIKNTWFDTRLYMKALKKKNFARIYALSKNEKHLKRYEKVMRILNKITKKFNKNFLYIENSVD